MTFTPAEIVDAKEHAERAYAFLAMASGAIILDDLGAAKTHARDAIAELRRAADALGMELIDACEGMGR